MSKQDVIDGLREVLHLSGSMAVPAGQTSNDQVFATLVSIAQGQVNTTKQAAQTLGQIKAATDTVEPKLDALGSALANLDVAALTATLTKAVQTALAAGIPADVLTQSFSDALGAGGLTVELSGTAKPGTTA